MAEERNTENNLIQSEKKSGKKSKKKSRKVRFLKILILVLVIGIVAALAVLMNTSNSDRRFVRSAVRGVESGWSLAKSEKELQESLDVKDAEFINKEYEAVSEYRDVSFRNKKLGQIAAQYIEALEGCRSAMDKYSKGSNKTQFWSEFAPYYGQRLRAIYSLYNGNYNYDIDDTGHQEQKDKCLVQGWALEKTSDIDFVEKKDKKGNATYQAEVKNDSGFDLAYLDIEVELLDKNGKLIETVSTYVDKWSNGEKKTLKLYSVSSKIVQCRVASVACDIESNTADSGDSNSSASDDK